MLAVNIKAPPGSSLAASLDQIGRRQGSNSQRDKHASHDVPTRASPQLGI
jgi:hypothetical protein